MVKNNKVIKEQTQQYQQLLERYEEMNDYLLDLIDEHERTEEEQRYMCIFREICASVPKERSAIPLETEQCSAS